MKRICTLVVLLLVLSTFAAASQSYVVSGTIRGIDAEGTLFVALFDEAGWDAAPDMDEGYVQGLSYDLAGAEVLEYRFEDVPPGRYAIRAFVDANGNQDLDMGMLGPREPWGVFEKSGPILGPPKFDNLSFEVAADIRNADFEMR
jgi:uncharacterized protein (DUF2141 family)